MPDHTIEAGDCLLNLAHAHGLRWETIWNHPNNSQLKAAAKIPIFSSPATSSSFPKGA